MSEIDWNTPCLEFFVKQSEWDDDKESATYTLKVIKDNYATEWTNYKADHLGLVTLLEKACNYTFPEKCLSMM